MLRSSAMLLLAFAAVAAPAGGAEAAIFTVNRTVGSGSVSGTLTTDGTLGALGTSNVIDWNLVLSNGSETINITPFSSEHLIVGQALSATSTQLVFDFSAASGAAMFQSPSIGWGFDFWCIEAAGCTANPGAMTVGVGFMPGNVVYATYSGPEVIGTLAAAVPAPASFMILATGLLGLGALGRQRG